MSPKRPPPAELPPCQEAAAPLLAWPWHLHPGSASPPQVSHGISTMVNLQFACLGNWTGDRAPPPRPTALCSGSTSSPRHRPPCSWGAGCCHMHPVRTGTPGLRCTRAPTEETSTGETALAELTYANTPNHSYRPTSNPENPHVQDGCLHPARPQPRRHPAHLAELLPVRVWDEGFQRLEASIDALHPPSLVAVGDFPAYPSLLVPLGLRSQRDVSQAGREARH